MKLSYLFLLSSYIGSAAAQNATVACNLPASIVVPGLDITADCVCTEGPTFDVECDVEGACQADVVDCDACAIVDEFFDLLDGECDCVNEVVSCSGVTTTTSTSNECYSCIVNDGTRCEEICLDAFLSAEDGDPTRACAECLLEPNPGCEEPCMGAFAEDDAASACTECIYTDGARCEEVCLGVFDDTTPTNGTTPAPGVTPAPGPAPTSDECYSCIVNDGARCEEICLDAFAMAEEGDPNRACAECLLEPNPGCEEPCTGAFAEDADADACTECIYTDGERCEELCLGVFDDATPAPGTETTAAPGTTPAPGPGTTPSPGTTPAPGPSTTPAPETSGATAAIVPTAFFLAVAATMIV